MIEVICIHGDSDIICEDLNTRLNEGWSIIDIQSHVYDSTGGLRRDTTVFLKKENIEQFRVVENHHY